jgi:predicted  nucleic acid-binding Zn-ribbon protein
MARDDRNTGSVLVQICIECGKEYMFDSGEPPDDLTCEKCGNGVFRSFHANARPDEASEDFRETTDRDLLTTDSASDVTSGDLHDLNNL